MKGRSYKVQDTMQFLEAIPVYPQELTVDQINKVAGTNKISSHVPTEAPICEDYRNGHVYLCWESEKQKRNYLDSYVTVPNLK